MHGKIAPNRVERESGIAPEGQTSVAQGGSPENDAQQNNRPGGAGVNRERFANRNKPPTT